jgi:hypothetical protein
MRVAGSPRRSTNQGRSHRQGQLALVRAARGLESRHAHAEQAHGALRVEAPQQLERDRPDAVGRAHRIRDRARAGVRREVVEPDLDADRPPAALLIGQRLTQLRDEAVQDLLQAPRIADVVIERRLARLGDDLALLGHRRVVLEARSALKLAGKPSPEARRQLDG